MKTLVSFMAVAASLAGCSSLTPVNDPVYLRITDMEARLIRIERVLENESLISLAGDITSLRNEVQLLLGDVETLRFEQQGQADRQRDLYVDIDQRLAALEAAQNRTQFAPNAGVGGPGGPGGFGGPGGPGGGPVVGDQQAYEAAFALIQGAGYAQAQAAFERFLATYPGSSRRDSAQYWLAEMHYGQGAFNTALPEFQKVIDNYPQSGIVPGAMLKVGFCYYELRQFDRARQVLVELTRQFPGSDNADRAEERLALMARESR